VRSPTIAFKEHPHQTQAIAGSFATRLIIAAATLHTENTHKKKVTDRSLAAAVYSINRFLGHLLLRFAGPPLVEAFFLQALDLPAAGQSANNRFLSGHIPTAFGVCSEAQSSAVATRTQGYQCVTSKRFLDHLEASRGNRPRSRNLRLTAIRSFFRFAALEAPDNGVLFSEC
jgi:hypothetical protein